MHIPSPNLAQILVSPGPHGTPPSPTFCFPATARRIFGTPHDRSVAACCPMAVFLLFCWRFPGAAFAAASRCVSWAAGCMPASPMYLLSRCWLELLRTPFFVAHSPILPTLCEGPCAGFVSPSTIDSCIACGLVMQNLLQHQCCHRCFWDPPFFIDRTGRPGFIVTHGWTVAWRCFRAKRRP